MKILAVILSIYVLLLSCLPCGDTRDCAEPEKTDISQNDHQDHEDTESCSPFCVCACCGTHMAFDFEYGVMTAENLQPALIEKVGSDLYHNSFISGFYGNIWQPPRV